MKTNVLPKSSIRRQEITFDVYYKLIKKPCIVDVYIFLKHVLKELKNKFLGKDLNAESIFAEDKNF